LAEITELIYAAHMLHRTVVETPDLKYVLTKNSTTCSSNVVEEAEDPNLSSIHLGNKLAILMGDMLLAKSSKRLAMLRNNKVTELMSDSIADFTESDFMSEKSAFCTSTNSSGSSSSKVNKNKGYENFAVQKDINACSDIHLFNTSYEKWHQRTRLGIGSLLGHACSCTAIFSEQNEATKRLVFELGEKIGLFLQVRFLNSPATATALMHEYELAKNLLQTLL